MFYIYYVSVNRHMMDVLKIYEKMGIIQLIRWHMLPQSKLIDPNRWIYRFGHTLSMNDCLYSSFAKYVALVDTDEFIIPNSGTLLPFLRKMHLNDTAGSFVFEHARVRFQGWILLKLQLKLDFAWLKNAEFQIQEGPSKTVFMPERVQIVLTHKVREFFKPYKSLKINTTDGLLYHARSNWIFTSLNNSIYHSTDIFSKYITLLNDKYQDIMSQVPWQDWNLIPLWKILSKKIEKCTSK
uniref:Glycosyltransferase family 92 protein n=1 Tax=Loa loa TaxID=7209 RepID=A0A1I7VRE4_LOALO